MIAGTTVPAQEGPGLQSCSTLHETQQKGWGPGYKSRKSQAQNKGLVTKPWVSGVGSIPRKSRHIHLCSFNLKNTLKDRYMLFPPYRGDMETTSD